MRYVTENDLTRDQYRRLRDEGTLIDVAPDTPKGAGADQFIMRYLHHAFYPEVKIDYSERAAVRR